MSVDDTIRTGLSLYDESFKKKIEEVFPNTIMAPPEIAMRRAQKRGHVELPLISMYRLSNDVDTSETTHPRVFHGAYSFLHKEDESVAQKIKDIGMNIEYQVDIYAQLRAHADGIFRELVFYLLNNPNLEVLIPEYGKPQVFALELSGTSQPTDYRTDDDRTLIHRYSLSYMVPRARLFYASDKVPLVKSIPIQVLPMKGKFIKPNDP